MLGVRLCHSKIRAIKYCTVSESTWFHPLGLLSALASNPGGCLANCCVFHPADSMFRDRVPPVGASVSKCIPIGPVTDSHSELPRHVTLLHTLQSSCLLPDFYNHTFGLKCFLRTSKISAKILSLGFAGATRLLSSAYCLLLGGCYVYHGTIKLHVLNHQYV